MATNLHKDLTDLQLHVPKGFAGAANSTTCQKDASGNLVWAAGGGGGGSSGGLVLAGGGRTQVSTALDAGSQLIGWGGSLGFGYYIWSLAFAVNPLLTSGDLGTPGTTQIVSVTMQNAIHGIIRVPASGVLDFNVMQEFDSSAEVASQVIRYMVWKCDAALVQALETGTGGVFLTATLVASATVTVPSSSQSLKPMSITSTNGVSVTAGDLVFGTTVYDGTVTTTQYFPTNISIYTV